MKRGLGTLSAVVVGAVALALGSGTAGAASGVLDSKSLAKQVAATVAPTYPTLPIGITTCPKKIKKQVGAIVVCDVDAGGLSLQFKVTQTDRKGAVTIESTQAVIPKAKAEEFVRNNATLPALVDCGPDAYLVRPPGMPFFCTARFADGTVQQVAVSVADVAGNVTITQVQ